MSRSEWVNLGCIIRKMPPRTKIVEEIRKQECDDQLKQIKRGTPTRV